MLAQPRYITQKEVLDLKKAKRRFLKTMSKIFARVPQQELLHQLTAVLSAASPNLG